MDYGYNPRPMSYAPGTAPGVNALQNQHRTAALQQPWPPKPGWLHTAVNDNRIQNGLSPLPAGVNSSAGIHTVTQPAAPPPPDTFNAAYMSPETAYGHFSDQELNHLVAQNGPIGRTGTSLPYNMGAGSDPMKPAYAGGPDANIGQHPWQPNLGVTGHYAPRPTAVQQQANWDRGVENSEMHSAAFALSHGMVPVVNPNTNQQMGYTPATASGDPMQAPQSPPGFAGSALPEQFQYANDRHGYGSYAAGMDRQRRYQNAVTPEEQKAMVMARAQHRPITWPQASLQANPGGYQGRMAAAFGPLPQFYGSYMGATPDAMNGMPPMGYGYGYGYGGYPQETNHLQGNAQQQPEPQPAPAPASGPGWLQNK